MKIDIRNLDNVPVGEVDLNPYLFEADLRPDILARVVHWQLMKRRAGTHKAKGISDISGTTKKPFRQKGTGRARQGSLRSPHMRGGAVIFGPQVRSHALGLPKKVRRMGLRVALSAKAAEGSLVVVDHLNLASFKTKDFAPKIRALAGESVLIISGAMIDDHLVRAASNLIGVDVLPQQGLNVYDVLRHHKLVLLKDVVPYLEERLA